MSIEYPEFYVMYNGTDDYPEKVTLKLSDLFKERKSKGNNLELTAIVYNVNKGKNKKILERSRTLNEYAAFIAKAREYKKNGLESAEALTKAVEDCVKNNILREFMEKYGGDVVSILSREFTMDDFIRLRIEEAVEEATEKATENTQEKIAENLLRDGISKDIVIKNTGLSVEQVKKIIQRINKE